MFLRVQTLFHITSDEVKIIGEKPYGIELTSRNGYGVAKAKEVGCYIFHSLGQSGWIPNMCDHWTCTGCKPESDDTELRPEASRDGDE